LTGLQLAVEAEIRFTKKARFRWSERLGQSWTRVVQTPARSFAIIQPRATMFLCTLPRCISNSVIYFIMLEGYT